MSDWFVRPTGFPEADYESTRSRLRVEGNELVSTVNGRRYGCGELPIPALAELRSRVNVPVAQRSTVGQRAIGLHRNVEVTDVIEGPRPIVSQAFCSALPVSYSMIPRAAWESFARLVLEAAYEATLLAVAEQATSGGSNTVLLTRLGGGAFGTVDPWIDDAIRRALAMVEHAGLDIRLVGYGTVHPSVPIIVDERR